MTHHVYVVSTEWGGSKGGINVFNKSLVEALALVVRADVEVHAIVGNQASLPVSLGSLKKFSTYDGSADSLVKTIEKDLSSLKAPPKSVAIIGHDVHTGPVAIEASNRLKLSSLNVQSAVFCHMDYAAYQRYKGTSIADIQDKVQKQRKIVCDADIVYAVGPLLKGSFESLRNEGNAHTKIYGE